MWVVTRSTPKSTIFLSLLPLPTGCWHPFQIGVWARKGVRVSSSEAFLAAGLARMQRL